VEATTTRHGRAIAAEATTVVSVSSPHWAKKRPE